MVNFWSTLQIVCETLIKHTNSFYVRFDESDAQKFSMFDSQPQKEYDALDARSA